jgi:hypothetical protein
MPRHLSPLLAVILGILGSPQIAHSEIDQMVWDSTLAVDEGVSELAPSSGAMAASDVGRYWVVYPKNGDIWCACRDTSGSGEWQTAQLTTSIARDTAPHLVASAGYVSIVWEQISSPHHSEIWSRDYNNDQWSVATCVSCDNVSSRTPVVAGSAGGGFLFVAWEDSAASGFSIMGRRKSGNTWLAVERIDSGNGSAREPSITIDQNGHVVCAWSDARSGTAQIYRRTLGSSEEVMTSQPFPCRHPAIQTGYIGWGVNPSPIVYEGIRPEGTDVFGVWRCVNQQVSWMISPDDGVASVAPFLDRLYPFQDDHCGVISEFAGTRFYVCWTDNPGSGAARHRIAGIRQCDNAPDSDLLDADGEATASFVTVPGDPKARGLELWVEEVGGVPTLRSRTGRFPGCSVPEFAVPPVLFITPAGDTPNTFRVYNQCGGEGMAHEWIEWSIEPEGLNLDPGQTVSGGGEADDLGEIHVPIRGGGCSPYALTRVFCLLGHEAYTTGARSPDIDGDCAVLADDVAYVTSKMGTPDFCADLDNSGFVGPEDLAIVVGAAGQHCTDVTVDAERDRPVLEPSLTIAPNPCTNRARIVLASTVPGAGVEIHDAGGRLLRRFAAAGPRQAIDTVWDLCDKEGRAIASGLYFVTARVPGAHPGPATLRRGLIVLR